MGRNSPRFPVSAELHAESSEFLWVIWLDGPHPSEDEYNLLSDGRGYHAYCASRRLFDVFTGSLEVHDKWGRCRR